MEIWLIEVVGRRGEFHVRNDEDSARRCYDIACQAFAGCVVAAWEMFTGRRLA